MQTLHRAATPADADRLLDLRRRSILALAPKGMSVADAQSWAATLTVAGMERKLLELEIWIAEVGDRVVQCGAIRDARLLTRILRVALHSG